MRSRCPGASAREPGVTRNSAGSTAAAAGAGNRVLAVRVRVSAAGGNVAKLPRGLSRATRRTWVGEAPRSRPRPRGPALAWSRMESHRKFARWPRRSCPGGTEVLTLPRFPPAPSGAPLPVSDSGNALCVRKEFSWRAVHRTHPQWRLGFSPGTSTWRSAWPLSVTHLSPPPGCRVCGAASAGGSFAQELSAALAALGW